MAVDDSVEKFGGPISPTRTYSFEGELSDVTQLAESNNRKYVNQGFAERSTKGEELQSDGFSQCSALIIQGLDKPQAYLAHIDKWNLSDKQYKELDKLAEGKYSVTFVTGSLSRVGSDSLTDTKVSDFMQRLKSKGREAEVRDDINVQSGDSHWWVSYNPKDRKLKILTRKDKTVSEYNLY